MTTPSYCFLLQKSSRLFFFVAVGVRQMSAVQPLPRVVASAFSLSRTTVGVLLAVLGYAIGTYGAILCAELMHAFSQVLIFIVANMLLKMSLT